MLALPVSPEGDRERMLKTKKKKMEPNPHPKSEPSEFAWLVSWDMGHWDKEKYGWSFNQENISTCRPGSSLSSSAKEDPAPCLLE